MKIFTLLFISALRNSRRSLLNMYHSNEENKSEFQQILDNFEKNKTINSTDTFDDFLNNDQRQYFKGYDMRNITVENEKDELITIAENFEKQNILKKLNSSGLSTIMKLQIIDNNNHLFEDDSYAPNIYKGGLLDDFNFEF